MRGRVGVVLTSGLAALALALALLQAAVVSHGVKRLPMPTASRTGPTNRYSAPGNRSAVPWAPFEKDPQQKTVPPESPEGRSPERRQQEEHRSPPPSPRLRGMPPRPGPQPQRKAVA